MSSIVLVYSKVRWLPPVFAELYRLFRVDQAQELMIVLV